MQTCMTCLKDTFLWNKLFCLFNLEFLIIYYPKSILHTRKYWCRATDYLFVIREFTRKYIGQSITIYVYLSKLSQNFLASFVYLCRIWGFGLFGNCWTRAVLVMLRSPSFVQCSKKYKPILNLWILFCEKSIVQSLHFFVSDGFSSIFL